MHPDNTKPVLFLQSSSALGGSTYSLLDLIRILRGSGYLAVVACPGRGWLTERLAEQATPYILLPFYAWRKWLERPWVGTSIRQQWLPMLAQWNFQLVHSNEFWWAPHAVKLARLLNVPSIVHLRDGHHTLKKARQYHLEQADLILAVSTDLRNQFLAHRQLYNKTEILFNGHDEQRVQGDRQLGRTTFDLQAHEIAIGNVGKLSERKNQRLLLRAMGNLKQQKRLTRFKVFFAGDAMPEYAELMRRDIRELELQDNVKFLGPVKEIGLFFAAMDLIVHCASREGFPRVVPEAMLAKRALVATAAQGIRDAIPDEQYGSVVPANDLLAVEREIERLVRDPGLRERMAARAYPRACSLFSFDAHRDHLLKLYDGLQAPEKDPAPPRDTRPDPSGGSL